MNSGMPIQRLMRHLIAGQRLLRKCLSVEDLAVIESTIAQMELAGDGEVCFAVEAHLPTAAILHGQSPRERALAVYSQLRIWDTEHNNGVLIYLLLADRAVEIVADRAAARQASQAEWDAICDAMRLAFAEGHFREGILSGVVQIGRILSRPWSEAPAGSSDAPANELPNTRVLR